MKPIVTFARCAGLVALAAFSSCSPAASEAEDRTHLMDESTYEVHEKSWLKMIPLAVKSGDQKFEFKVELAKSRIEQAKGLMFRTRLGPDEGMLFPFDPPRAASFWMKNTVISLDIIFIAPDNLILNIEADAVPYSETPRLSRGLAAAVLELPGGRAAQLGIAPGDMVEW